MCELCSLGAGVFTSSSWIQHSHASTRVAEWIWSTVLLFTNGEPAMNLTVTRYAVSEQSGIESVFIMWTSEFCKGS